VKSVELLERIAHHRAVAAHPDADPAVRAEHQRHVQRLGLELAEVLARGETPVARAKKRLERLKAAVDKDKARAKKEIARAARARRAASKARRLEQQMRRPQDRQPA
jgi:uncharacterized protein YqfA (UPF0365 family)